MNATKLLAEAKASPDKRGLEPYLETIWELQRKGHSYRQIAEFLKQRGVDTDHTAVFRLVTSGNPVLNFRDGLILNGDVAFESRKGRPLRPFDAGLLITIEKKLRIILLEDPIRVYPTWCEAQFKLNSEPNLCWLEQLCKCLHMDWNLENPCHLQSRIGFDLKFEANIMALVCQTFNLETMLKDVAIGVNAATKFFLKDKTHLARQLKLRDERKVRILEQHVLRPGADEDDECAEFSEWFRQRENELTKRFQSIQLP